MRVPRLPELGSRSAGHDIRAVRTRKRLVNAYVALTSDGRAAPTAADVARTARVNRSSFYAHFHDIEDLTLYVLDSALEAIYRQHTVAPADRDPTQLRDSTSAAILTAVRDRVAALKAAVHADRAQARKRIGLAIEQQALDVLRSLPDWDGVDAAHLKLLACYLGHGWSGIICAYVMGEVTGEPDEMMAELLRVNPDGARFRRLVR
jgi:AcrR family transcriptional regulator